MKAAPQLAPQKVTESGSFQPVTSLLGTLGTSVRMMTFLTIDNVVTVALTITGPFNKVSICLYVMYVRTLGQYGFFDWENGHEAELKLLQAGPDNCLRFIATVRTARLCQWVTIRFKSCLLIR